MNRTLQLQQDKTAALDQANAILTKVHEEKRSAMTPEERTEFDAHTKKAEDISALIESEAKLTSLTGNAHTDRSAPTGAGKVQVHDRWTDNPTLFGHEARGSETKDERRARLMLGFGEQLRTVRQAELIQHSGAGGQVDKRLFQLQERAAAAGASEQIPADGGFLVAPEFASEIMQITHEVGLIYTKVRNVPIGETTNAIKIPGIDEQSRVDGSRWGGVRAYWQNEADALTGSKPKFRLIEMVLKKLTGLYYATDELLADATALGSIVMQAFGEEMAFKKDDGVIRGGGNGQMLGILNSPSLVTVAKESGQTAATVVYANIQKMWGRMWPRSRQNAIWFMNQDVEQQISGLTISGSNSGVFPVMLPAGGASGNQYATIYGRPVITVEQCDTLGQVSDIMLIDPTQYLTIDKGEMQSAVSMHVRFLTDEATYRWITRLDGQPGWATPLTPFKGSNSLSPFVALAAR